MAEKTFDLLEGYSFAKNFVINSGFNDEINWQRYIKFEDVNETDFLRESAWVILCSGMRERIVKKYFRDISFCFLEWESAKRIVDMEKYCIESALKFFNNHLKISAIVKTAKILLNYEFEELKKKLKQSPVYTLRNFPFMGPITSYHLAKNLGLPVAKSDRHLSRLSQYFGYSSVENFCQEISNGSGDPIAVVDIVLWRFAVLKKDYLIEFFTRSSNKKESILNREHFFFLIYVQPQPTTVSKSAM